MDQKVPNVSDDDIRRIVKRDFSHLEFSQIESILKMYDSKSQKGRNRIYASILKLAAGNIELIKEYVAKARNDYRDVVALAEYPNYSEYGFEEDLPDDKISQLINDDWIQYQTWFNKL